jgi:folate-binding protein YgfZ
MLSEWQAFLKERGAQFAPSGGVDHFAEPRDEARAALAGDIIADLSPLALIVATGADVAHLFQGQFTNNIDALRNTHCQLSAYCNTKGRVLAFFRVLRRDDEYWLELPAGLAEAFIARLRRYVLRADVRLRLSDDTRVGMGVSGTQAFSAMADIYGDLPESIHDVRFADELTMVRVPGPYPRLQFYGPPARARALWERLEAVARPVGFGAWSLLDIRAGIPTVQLETSEQFLPQMLNLQAFDALNFNKGCYIGQEIVARTHYLGRVKRRLFRFCANARIRPAPGDPLVAASGASAGSVVAAELDENGGWEMLAVVGTEAATSHLRLERDPNVELQIASLPYALEQPPASATES